MGMGNAFVGLSEDSAAAALDALDLPILIGQTVRDPSVPVNTVLAQDPAANVGMACQCTVVLTVSRKS